MPKSFLKAGPVALATAFALCVTGAAAVAIPQHPGVERHSEPAMQADADASAASSKYGYDSLRIVNGKGGVAVSPTTVSAKPEDLMSSVDASSEPAAAAMPDTASAPIRIEKEIPESFVGVRDGARFHQHQGWNLEQTAIEDQEATGDACGATSFTMALNMLLGENRSHLEIYNSPEVGRNSADAMGDKMYSWVLNNGLGDRLECRGVYGAINASSTADDIKALIDEGYVICISSGAAGYFQHNFSPADLHPAGHFICIYGYDMEEGGPRFHVDDPGVDAADGSDIVYTAEQMTQWLQGRDSHWGIAMRSK